jgi:hypothetical protein
MPAAEVDPFELPDWLAEEQVLWQAAENQRDREHSATIHGQVHPLYGGRSLALDLLAVDVAWPKPVCDDDSRHLAHEAWHYGQVALFERDGRTTLGVPCREFSSDLVCEAVRRFSKAVGADSTHFLVQLRL